MELRAAMGLHGGCVGNVSTLKMKAEKSLHFRLLCSIIIMIDYTVLQVRSVRYAWSVYEK